MGPAWDELGALGGAVGHKFHHGEQVLEGIVGIRSRWKLDVLAPGSRGVIRGEQFVEWGQQSFPIGDCQTSMLEFTHNGLEVGI